MFGLSVRRESYILPQIIRRSYVDGPSFRERWADMDEEEKERVRKSRKLKAWRAPMEPQDHYLQAFNISTNKHGFFSNKFSLKLTDWFSWYKQHQMDYVKWSQRYIPERQQTLGNDLALAHFVVHRNGKVRMKGSQTFMDIKNALDLPDTFTPNWFLEEVDVSGTEICYEGLENFANLGRLKIAAFRNCQYFDDWCLERILNMCPNLEVLDISDNVKITERGLEGAYRNCNLKKLIVTDWGYGVSFELVCLMLEDAVPGLQVEIKTPTVANEKLNASPDVVAESTIKRDQVFK
ncbi:ATP synthase subunit s-like protein [Fopius arisanus]|uniref:ATP synthase subunit s-like protein n=1 Tax=Fopius arisanus TaxID=64838 RepID=A0A0C9Q6Z0_9HYME|nr:PREDICTED: ATP synthase subunit s-like protein [Fopius arisanus]